MKREDGEWYSGALFATVDSGNLMVSLRVDSFFLLLSKGPGWGSLQLRDKQDTTVVILSFSPSLFPCSSLSPSLLICTHKTR